MPQVDKAVIKDRAARLREKGQQALTRHLDGRVGREMTVLIEKPGQARADDFTPVLLDAPARSGARLRARMTGHDGAKLIAEPIEAIA